MHAAYDSIAEWYDRFVRDGVFISAEQVVEASGLDLNGAKVCDLGCGQGHLARHLASRGGAVTGVDISERLLDIARTEEAVHPQAIRYVQADAQDLPILQEEPFDYVFLTLVLMDIADLEAVIRGVQRILRADGSLISTITHPCFQYPKGRAYTEEGFWRSDNPHGVRGQVGAHHRTLSTYLSTFGSAGLLIDRVVELQLPAYELPPALLFRCRNNGI